MSLEPRPVERQFDLDALLNPARAFVHPMNVVRDPGLSINEKRAILASWASDACAVEAAPDLRLTDAGRIVRWDDVMDALRTLDEMAEGRRDPVPRYKRILSRKRGSLPCARQSTQRGRGDGPTMGGAL